jgi:hypothetical protein
MNNVEILTPNGNGVLNKIYIKLINLHLTFLFSIYLFSSDKSF